MIECVIAVVVNFMYNPPGEFLHALCPSNFAKNVWANLGYDRRQMYEIPRSGIGIHVISAQTSYGIQIINGH